jgi:hypothetical protein
MRNFILRLARRLVALSGLWVALEFCLTIAAKKWILSSYVWNLASRLVSPATPYQTILIWVTAVFFMMVLIFIVVRIIKEIEYLEAA